MLIFQLLIYTVVFIFFTLYKDYVINTYYREVTNEKKSYINKRWLIFYTIGLVITFLLYSCNTEDENCQKGIANNNVACIKIYRPVKAPDGTLYSNSCIAEADGWDNNCLILVDA